MMHSLASLRRNSSFFADHFAEKFIIESDVGESATRTMDERP